MERTKLNLDNDHVKSLLDRPKEDLVLLYLDYRERFHKEQAQARWLDQLADYLRDGGRDEEISESSLYEDYKEEDKEILSRYNNYFIQ